MHNNQLDATPASVGARRWLSGVLAILVVLTLVVWDAVTPTRANADDPGEIIEIGYVEAPPSTDKPGVHSGTILLGTVTYQERGNGVTRFTMHYQPEIGDSAPFQCGNFNHFPYDWAGESFDSWSWYTPGLHELQFSLGAGVTLVNFGGGVAYVSGLIGGGPWDPSTVSNPVLDAFGASIAPEERRQDISVPQARFTAGDEIWFDVILPPGYSLLEAAARGEFVRDNGLLKAHYTDRDSWYGQQMIPNWCRNQYFAYRGSRFVSTLEASPVEASAEHAISESQRGEVTFASTSTQRFGLHLEHEWDFGDGFVAGAASQTHVFDTPGEHQVGLRVTDPDGETDTTAITVDLPAPELTATWSDLPDGITAGEPFEVELLLAASDTVDDVLTVGDLSNVLPIDDVMLWASENIEVVSEPLVPVGGFTLEPGAEPTSLIWEVKVTEGLDFALRSKWEGSDAAERPVVPVEAMIEGELTAVLVEVEVIYPRPPEGSDVEVGPPAYDADNNGDGVIDEADHRIDVEVTVTNALAETLTDVGPVAGGDHPVSFSNLLYADGQVSLFLAEGAAEPGEDPELRSTSFGDIEAGESVVRRYTYDAKGMVLAEARAMIEGVPEESGGVVREIGRAEVKLISNLALEVELELEDRPYISGQTVRVSGSAKSLLADELDEDGAVVEEAPSLGVLIVPHTEENAGNGFLTVGGAGGATPVGPEPFILRPEEEVDLSGVLVTQRWPEASQAKVTYEVFAWELDDEMVAVEEIDSARIMWANQAVQSYFTAERSLAAVDFTPDSIQECQDDHLGVVVSCELVVGLRNFAQGIPDLAWMAAEGVKQTHAAKRNVTAWGMETFVRSLEALQGDPAAMQALTTELEVQLETFRAMGIMTGDAAVSATQLVTGFIDDSKEAIETGDLDTILRFYARQGGENIDALLPVLNRARTFATVMRAQAAERFQSPASRAIKEATEQSARETAEALEQKIRESLRRGEDPTTNKTFRGGEDITDMPGLRKTVYGMDKITDANVRKIAQAENVNIGGRSRPAAAARAISEGRAQPKPQSLKMKTTNIIDVEYLGHRFDSLGMIELVEPPVNWRLKGAELDAAIDAHMATLASRHPQIANDAAWAAEVRKRLKMRTEEFPMQMDELLRMNREGIKLEFGYDQQGISHWWNSEVSEIRPARVRAEKGRGLDGVERTHWVLEMEAPGSTGNYTRIAGDNDIVFITNPDGTPILDPIKQRRIYEQLQELIGMQHGETMTYINEEVRQKLLRNHVYGVDGAEALIVYGADGRVRIGYLQEAFSAHIDPDTGLPIFTGEKHFTVVSGAPPEAYSSPLRGQAADIVWYMDVLWQIRDGIDAFKLDKLKEFIDGLNTAAVTIEESFDYEGLILVPDGQGGMLVYVEGGDPPPGWVKAGDLETSQTESTPFVISAVRSSGEPQILPLRDSDDGHAEAEQIVSEAAALGLLPPERPAVGAAGGRWLEADVDAYLTDVDSTVVLAPMTTLAETVDAGENRIVPNGPTVMGMSEDSDWFAPGDRIVINPGSSREEIHTVKAYGSLILASPLANDHPAGTLIAMLPTRTGPDGPGAPGDGAGSVPGAGGTGSTGNAGGGDGTVDGSPSVTRDSSSPLPTTGGTADFAALLGGLVLVLSGLTLTRRRKRSAQ